MAVKPWLWGIGLFLYACIGLALARNAAQSDPKQKASEINATLVAYAILWPFWIVAFGIAELWKFIVWRGHPNADK